MRIHKPIQRPNPNPGETMSEQAHHYTAEGILYVDSAFLRSVGDLVHLGFGDFRTDDRRATFVRRDDSMEAPSDFIGRIHSVRADSLIHPDLITQAQSLAVKATS
jgi:hypothetical protein